LTRRDKASEITPHLVSSTRRDKAILMTNEYELVLTSYTFVFILYASTIVITNFVCIRIDNCVIPAFVFTIAFVFIIALVLTIAFVVTSAFVITIALVVTIA
jgi:hypothetical protein